MGMTLDRHDLSSQLPQLTGTSRPAQVWAKIASEFRATSSFESTSIDCLR